MLNLLFYNDDMKNKIKLFIKVGEKIVSQLNQFKKKKKMISHTRFLLKQNIKNIIFGVIKCKSIKIIIGKM